MPSRAYCLLEWTGQWLLRARMQIDTSDLQPAQIPPGLEIAPERNGKLQAGLFKAWALAV